MAKRRWPSSSRAIPTIHRLLDVLPRNASGKVLKTRLRAEHGATDVVASPTV